MIDFWRSLGRKEAINWISVALLLFIQLNGALLVDFKVDLEGKMPLFWLANALPFLPMALVLACGRYVLNPRLPTWLRPLSTLILFETSILLRLTTFDWLLQNFGITDSSQFWARFGAAQANQLIVLVVMGYLIASARDFSRQNSQLATLLATSKNTQLDLHSRLQSRKQSLISNIETQLSSSLALADGNNSSHDAERLKDLIDTVVRPLSYQLGRGARLDLESKLEVPETKIALRNLIRQTFTGNPVYPLISVLWMYFPLLTSLASYNKPNTLANSLVFSIIFLGVLVLFRFFWNQVPQHWGLPARIILFITVPFVLSVLGGWFFFLISEINSYDKIIMLFFYFVAILTTIALVGTSRRMLKDLNSELTLANNEVRREIVSENSEARQFEESMSRVLHGPIQDAIWASLLRLEQFAPNTKLTKKDIEYVRQPIAEALLLLKEPDTKTQNIEESIQELIELWSGAVAINLDISLDLTQHIEASEGTNRVLAEILREAISNAIRHGDATEVDVHLALDPKGQDILLVVSNNGFPVSEASTPGLGTQLLNDLTIMWTRKNDANRVVLEATVPLLQRN
ncbi:hypothetical protein [Aurantimicrobium sp. MWH-Uga1]|uniref:hypothetical protein n=1 Tax=Aurantimicrobium sp. MWH-Uga1 TaxID=2079575 RepID=UPI000DED423C|nr:hypothetical protein [Aurantimicrobium sp. MWH-Uga1]AXE53853.1 nitrate/nitrite sensor protein NarX [Aurantimicrobium sp. MWH-Uga1]